MDQVQRYDRLPGSPPLRIDATHLLRLISVQAAFYPLTARHLAALYAAPVRCAAVTITCFREDGALLTWRSRRDPLWDVPYCVLPPGADPAHFATHLLANAAGVMPAQRLQVFGLLDWGPAARAAGWGWTACLFGNVGAVTPLPGPSEVSGRAFLPPGQIRAGAPPDPWQRVRRSMLQEATGLFVAARDFWLLQTWDALIMYDLDDVLGQAVPTGLSGVTGGRGFDKQRPDLV